jgi:predicted alpha-1,2-mannosidase
MIVSLCIVRVINTFASMFAILEQISNLVFGATTIKRTEMRHRKLPAILLGALIPISLAHANEGSQRDLLSWVNPLIGTTNGGNVFPGAVVPFGMVQFSPEASPYRKGSAIAAPGGYEYRSDKIRGFSLTNVEGWGCAGGSGDVPVMPVTETITASPSSDFRNSYNAGFSHSKEKASPGHYQVALENGVNVDLTASLHTGSALFQYPDGSPANLLIRTSDSEVGSTDAHTSIDTKRHIVTGSVTSGNFCGYINKADRHSYYTLYFVAEFDQPFVQTGSWHDSQVTPGSLTASGGTGFGEKGFPGKGQGSGVWVSFDPAHARQVHVRIGISYVSEANARANLKAENPSGTAFDTVRERAEAAWRHKLGQIEVTGGTDDQRTVFTTALYHAMMTPNVYSDVNGEYNGMDGKTHHVTGHQHAQYANFSGWDVYRSQLQLVTWLDPSVGSDIAQSLFNQSEQNGGAWDRWTHNSGSTHVMNGDPAAPALADIWAFGGHDFDARSSLASLVRAADHPTTDDLDKAGCEVECVGERPGLDQWLKLHYIPVGAPSWGPAADTLEDVAAEFGISSLAERLGETATSQRFAARAQYWRNIWNPKATPEGGYFQNRNADGSWALVRDDGDKAPHAFTPATGDGFVEGSAAQYVWMIPFNVHGLFEAMGGKEKAATRLDAFFYDEKGAPAVTKAGPLHAELDNEPSIETPWLYDFASQPWKTQQLVRQVLNTIWVNAPNGIPGNDDLGEMSSWAVFASLGFYPEIPGRAELVLGSPLFPKAVIHRPGGDVTINASGASADTPYINALKIDGKSASTTWLPESFAEHGGTLDFTLSNTPNKSWGTSDGDQPPSFDSK